MKAGVDTSKAKVLILGATFKENCPDIRNSKVFDIYNGLKEFGITPEVFDDNAIASEIEHEYGVIPIDKKELKDFDCIVAAVGHESFKLLNIEKMFKDIDNKFKVIIDVKSILDKDYFASRGYKIWRL